MTLLARFLCHCFCGAFLLSPLTVIADEHCRPLIRFSFAQLSISDAQQHRLADRIYAALSSADERQDDAATLLPACKPYSQITLRDTYSSPDNNYVSRHQLGTIPAFSRLSLPGNAAADSIVGQQQRPYSLEFDYPTYPIDSDDTAITLLRNGRVSHIVDYAVNMPIYQEQLGSVKVEQLRTQRPIYLLFDQADLRDQFDRVAGPELRAKAQQDPASRPVSKTSHIQWLVLNKFFSQQEDLLVAMESEVAALAWLDERLTTHTFSVAKTSSAVALERMQTEPDVCVLGIYKTPERQAFAWYSQPTNWFLSPRLYVNNGADTDLTDYLDPSGRLDAIAALNSHPALAVGYVPEMLRALPQLKAFMQRQPQRFLNMDAFERERMLALYDKQRLDGFIDYPSHLAQARDFADSVVDIKSYALMQQKIIGQAYAACSKSADGRAMIDALNDTLTDPAARFHYIAIMAKGMTLQAQRILHEAAGTLTYFEQFNETK